MKSNLTISLVQAKLAWEDSTANLKHFTAQLAKLQAGETDLVVLPEMFTTGFSMRASALAEPSRGGAYDWMAGQAERLQAVVTGSLIVVEDGHYYNRLLWVYPDGRCLHYDKRHLFTLAGEQEYYQPGASRLLAEWHGWKVMPLICYDLRFPVWSRNDLGYDLLLYVANWPAKRRAAWNQLLCARAIENQAYTIGVNRVGQDGNAYPHAGDTSVYDYAGQQLLHLAEVESLVTLKIDRQAQQAFREALPFLSDQDGFSLV